MERGDTGRLEQAKTIMRISLALGNYAKSPYTIPGLDARVYCIEELCYLLGENALLLDGTLMNGRLVDWVDKELGLEDLAREMNSIIARHGSLSTFVCLIMEYTGLQDTVYIDSVRKTLKRVAGLSSIERHKSQIDYLVRKKKYSSAVRGYRALLEKWDLMSRNDNEKLPAGNVLAAIYHNLGVAYTGLMLYERAADSFNDAFKVSGDKQHYSAYLAAKRMGMNDKDYVSFASGIPDSYDETLLLEKTIESLTREWNQSAEANRLELRSSAIGTGEEYKYVAENTAILEGLKNGYRENVGG